MSCCGGVSGGTFVVSSSRNRSVFTYNNELTCGVTIDRLKNIDITVTKEYKKSKNPYLLSVNSELRKLINSFNRTNICEMIVQIEDWEKTYGIR